MLHKQTYLKSIPTGRTFTRAQVYNGHKRGVLCVSCGIYARKLKCPECKKLDKCKLCGILCKVNPTNKVYNYIRNKTTNLFDEVFHEIDTRCEILSDSFCAECLGWEKFMKNVCFVCGGVFFNTYKNFKDRGNCCAECNRIVLREWKRKNKFGRARNQNMVH
jgi:hypothetical protein